MARRKDVTNIPRNEMLSFRCADVIPSIGLNQPSD